MRGHRKISERGQHSHTPPELTVVKMTDNVEWISLGVQVGRNSESGLRSDL